MAAPSARDTFNDIAILVADEEAGVMPAVIGKIVFYQISDDIRISPADLKALMDSRQVDTAFVPKAINPRSIISKMLNSYDQKITIKNQAHKLAFMVDEKIDGAIVGRLTKTRRTEDSEREWDMTTVARVVWTPEEPTALAVEVLSKYANEYPYDAALEEITVDFDERTAYYTGGQIRTLVNAVLKSVTSLSVRPAGGVWLVPKEGLEAIGNLETLVTDLATHFVKSPDPDEDGETATPSGAVEFVTLPVFDVSSGRIFIQGRVETQIVKDLEGAISQLVSLRRAGVTPRPEDLARIVAARKAALGIVDHYQYAITSEMSRVTAMLEVFDQGFATVATLGLPDAQDDEDEDEEA